MGDVNLGAIKAKLEVDASGVDAGVAKATAALNGFNAEAIKVGAAFGVGFEVAVKAIEGVGNALASVGQFMASAVTETAKYSEHITNMALVTGLSVDMLQSLGKAAQETGASSEGLIRSVARMEVAIANDSKAFASLGLSLQELKASSPEEALKKVAAQLLSMTDVAERNAAAQKILGRAYMDVLPALQQYATESERYVNLTKDQIAASEDVDAALDQLGTAWDDLKKQIGAALSTPEVREAIRALAESVREIAVSMRDGKGDVAAFFKAVAEGAVNAGKWVVFLRGAIDGLHERMASAGKDTPGALARGFEALTAFENKLAAAKNKEGLLELGRQWTPGLFKGPAITAPPTKEAEAAAKKLQAEMDRISGAKAQAEMNLVAAAVKNLGTNGVADVGALGKQLVTLGAQGAKVPTQLMGPWTDAFIKEASKVGKLPTNLESLTKSVAEAYKSNTQTIAAALKEQEAIEKQHFENLKLLEQGQGDILEEQYKLGLISEKEYYTKAGQMQVEYYQKKAAILRAAAALEKDPAVRAALLAQADAYERIAAAAGKAAAGITRAAQVSKVFGTIGAALGGVANLFDAIGVSADSTAGKMLNAAQGALEAGQNFNAALGDKGWSGASGSQKIAAVGSAAGTAGDIYKTGQNKGALAGMGSGALKGAAIGAMFGPYGMAIGAVAGAAVGLIGSLNKPEFKKIAADVGKNWGVKISEGLAKEIEQIAKTHKISRTLAELMDVSKIMGESGKDPREFTGKINDLMNAIKSGAVPAKEGLAELGKAFTMVADAAVAAGTVGDKAMVGLLKRARELGQVTPEMKAFVGSQLESALAGMSKYVAAINKIGEATMKGKTTASGWGEIAKTSGVVFGAMFQAMVSEKGITAAVDAMKSDYESLHKTLMDTLGPETTAAILGPFGAAFATLGDETLRPIFEGIDGITQAMTGLANAGYLSTDQFGAMQDATAQLFDEAVAGGADMRTALLAVAPGIQAAISAAEQFGVPLDADMLRLKGLAEQNGITFAVDAQAAMLDVLVAIAQVLGADVPASAMRAKAAMQDMANSVPNDLSFDVNVNRNYTDNYGGGGGGGGTGGGPEGGGGEAFAPGEPIPGGGGEPIPYEGFQHGSGGVRDFGPGTNVTLHGKEAVVTEKQMTTMGAAPVSITMSPTFTGDPLMSNESRKDLSAFQIEEFIRQVKNSPYMQQILRQGGLR